MYGLRSGLAVLDCNEHVDIAFTSVYTKHDVQHSRRKSGKKRYEDKKYTFVQELWRTLLSIFDNNLEMALPDEENTESSDPESDIDVVN
jgi:hypothetical protein